MDVQVKRRRFGAFSILGAIVAIVLIFHACDNFGIDANYIKGTIRGEIVLNQPVPSNTDEIRVAVTKNYPPSDIINLIFSGPLPFNADTLVASQNIPYDLQVPLDDYEAVFAIWKEKDQSFNPADIIGLYGDLQLAQPIPIATTAAEPVVSSVDIAIDFAKVQRTAKIEGRITYVGAWPANTAAVAIFAFFEVPQVLPDDFIRYLGAFEILPTDPTLQQYDFRLRVPPGTYKYLAVFWLAQGAPLLDFKTLGFYRSPPVPEQPGEVTVGNNETITGIDISADFSNAH
ncbi:MAG TPA: hypothetical protein VGA99_01875 [bacterium]